MEFPNCGSLPFLGAESLPPDYLKELLGPRNTDPYKIHFLLVIFHQAIHEGKPHLFIGAYCNSLTQTSISRLGKPPKCVVKPLFETQGNETIDGSLIPIICSISQFPTLALTVHPKRGRTIHGPWPHPRPKWPGSWSCLAGDLSFHLYKIITSSGLRSIQLSSFLRSSIGWWFFGFLRCRNAVPVRNRTGFSFSRTWALFTHVLFNMKHDMNICQLKSNWWLQVAYRTYIQHNRGCHLRWISACSKNVANVIQSRRSAMR